MSLHDTGFSTPAEPEIDGAVTALDWPPRRTRGTEFDVAFELVNICERVRGHVAAGMEPQAAISWVVESQMAAEDSEHPEFLRFLRERNLIKL